MQSKEKETEDVAGAEVHPSGFCAAALLFYANSKKRQSRIVGWNSWQDRTRQLAEAGLVTGCVLLGTFVESFVNPAVFAWVLKIFC